MPLAQPTAAASATSCQVSNVAMPGRCHRSSRFVTRQSHVRHPRRRALAEERRDALLAFRRRAHARDARRRVRDHARRRSAAARPRGSAPCIRPAPAARRASSAPRSSLILPSSSASGADVVHEPDPKRLRRGEALGRQEVAPRLPRADRLDDVGCDRRGNEPELRLGQRERRILRGERDVAAGDEADAAAERGAVHARDRRLRRACRACAASPPAPSRRRDSRRAP